MTHRARLCVQSATGGRTEGAIGMAWIRPACVNGDDGSAAFVHEPRAEEGWRREATGRLALSSKEGSMMMMFERGRMHVGWEEVPAPLPRL